MNNQESHILLSRFSHEVRNPVALISSFLQLLVREYPEIAASPYCRQIEENMRLLRQLLDDMSRYNNASGIHPETADLHQFLTELSLSAGAVLSARHIRLRTEFLTPLPPVSIDRSRMLQVFYNLLRNAEEAMPQGGEITISAFSEDSRVCISVRDSGPGIPPEYLSTLFDPLITHKQDGTGLGLAICREILTAHGGTISVAPDGAPVFTIRLPSGRSPLPS